MFFTNQRVELTRELSTGHAIIKAGTKGIVEKNMALEGGHGLYKVLFEIPRKYDVKRFGRFLTLRVEVLEDELRAVQ